MKQNRAGLARWFALIVIVATGYAVADETDAAEQRPINDVSSGALRGRYPSGSMTTRASAQSALQETAERNEQIDRAYLLERDRCYRTFFVNQCLDDARQRQIAGRRDLRAVEVDAKDRIRAIDANEREAKRSAETRVRETQAQRAHQQEEGRRADLQRRQLEATSRTAAQSRASIKPGARRDGGELTPRLQRSAPLGGNRLDADQRAVNASQFDRKSIDAAEYAKKKAAEKADNVKRRQQRSNDRVTRAEQDPTRSTLPVPGKPQAAQ